MQGKCHAENWVKKGITEVASVQFIAGWPIFWTTMFVYWTTCSKLVQTCQEQPPDNIPLICHNGYIDNTIE